MVAYLIVGLPGSGKSTTLQELGKLGYDTLDADDDEKLSLWRHRISGETTRHRQPNDPAWNQKYSWSWDSERLQHLINKSAERLLFVGGNASNVSEFYGIFNKVFALILDNTTLERRVIDRKHGYGLKSEELRSIMEWNADFADIEIQRGAALVDAHPAPSAIAQFILKAIDERT